MTTTIDPTGWTETPATYSDRPTAQQLASKAKPLPAEMVGVIEKSRADREAKKLAIAGAVYAEEEWRQLNQVYEFDIPQRKEMLAAEHCTAAAPLQSRLADVETAIIAAIENRAAADPKLEAERTELLATLQQMNADLKAAIAREDGIADEVWKQRQIAGSKANRSILENELVELASPALRIALQVAGSSTHWAQARLTRAQENMQARVTAYHRAELAFAQNEYARTKQIEAAAVQACLDE